MTAADLILRPRRIEGTSANESLGQMTVQFFNTWSPQADETRARAAPATAPWVVALFLLAAFALACVTARDGLVDIYMPDFKVWRSEHAREYLAASGYAEVARQVIAEMHRQVGVLHVDEEGLAVRGVLVRHLVMPGLLDDTRQIGHA